VCVCFPTMALVRQCPICAEERGKADFLPMNICDGDTDVNSSTDSYSCDSVSDHDELLTRDTTDFRLLETLPTCSKISNAASLSSSRAWSLASREATLRALSRRSWHPRSLLRLPKEARQDRELALLAVRRSGTALSFLEPSLTADTEIVFAAVLQCASALRFADTKLRADAGFISKLVHRCPEALQHAAPCCADDRNVVLEAVVRGGKALRHASARLRADPDVAMAAIDRNCKALLWVHESLLISRGFVSTVVARHPKALRFAAAWRDDKHLVLLAVQSNGCALAHASDSLRANKALVLTAIQQQQRALRYADLKLVADLEVQQHLGHAMRDWWLDNFANAITC